MHEEDSRRDLTLGDPSSSPLRIPPLPGGPVPGPIVLVPRRCARVRLSGCDSTWPKEPHSGQHAGHPDDSGGQTGWAARDCLPAHAHLPRSSTRGQVRRQALWGRDGAGLGPPCARPSLPTPQSPREGGESHGPLRRQRAEEKHAQEESRCPGPQTFLVRPLPRVHGAWPELAAAVGVLGRAPWEHPL